uniref:Uncharacterized protein n=1 Tax=Magnetococcus massalia (strain MO-1) TaxID=451514 RepID=A0A1S7LNW2_MAGMO|nr:protein of unknown function [Candidatus Magnetococcus massalia]
MVAYILHTQPSSQGQFTLGILSVFFTYAHFIAVVRVSILQTPFLGSQVLYYPRSSYQEKAINTNLLGHLSGCLDCANNSVVGKLDWSADSLLHAAFSKGTIFRRILFATVSG